MRSSLALAAASLAAGVYAAHENATMPMYTTEVVTEYTTYCPEPTSIVHKNETYTVTAPTTLTITNCPCTVTKPLIVSTVTTCDSCPSSTSVMTTVAETSPGLVTSAPVETAQPTQPAPYVPSASPPLYTNGTVTIPTLKPTSPVASASGPSTSPGAPADASTTSPALPTATGAANRAFVASSAAALAGLVGLAAYML